MMTDKELDAVREVHKDAVYIEKGFGGKETRGTRMVGQLLDEVDRLKAEIDDMRETTRLDRRLIKELQDSYDESLEEKTRLRRIEAAAKLVQKEYDMRMSPLVGSEQHNQKFKEAKSELKAALEST